MKNLKIEKTLTIEKETFIHIAKWDKSITITTHDPVVFKTLLKVLGTPTQVFPPVNKGLSKNYISGASWTFDYFKDRAETRNAFKMSNYIPRKKDICNWYLYNQSMS